MSSTIKKVIIFALAFIVVILLILGATSKLGNRGIGVDLNNRFNRAIIKLGEMVHEIGIKSWRDFDNSDTVQIIGEDGTVYLTHYNNVILINRSAK